MRESPGVSARIAALSVDHEPTAITRCPHMDLAKSQTASRSSRLNRSDRHAVLTGCRLGSLRQAGHLQHRPRPAVPRPALSPVAPHPLPLAGDGAVDWLLSRRQVYVLPGKAVEMPGYFRFSLTATDAMIDMALPVFADAIQQVATTRVK